MVIESKVAGIPLSIEVDRCFCHPARIETQILEGE